MLQLPEPLTEGCSQEYQFLALPDRSSSEKKPSVADTERRLAHVCTQAEQVPRCDQHTDSAFYARVQRNSATAATFFLFLAKHKKKGSTQTPALSRETQAPGRVRKDLKMLLCSTPDSAVAHAFGKTAAAGPPMRGRHTQVHTCTQLCCS